MRQSWTTNATGDGNVRLSLKQPWPDGTTDLIFTPIALLERLAVLVPRPRINLLLYFGVMGARAAGPAAFVGLTARAGEAAAAGHARRRQWAELMARTFGLSAIANP